MWLILSMRCVIECDGTRCLGPAYSIWLESWPLSVRRWTVRLSASRLSRTGEGGRWNSMCVATWLSANVHEGASRRCAIICTSCEEDHSTGLSLHCSNCPCGHLQHSRNGTNMLLSCYCWHSTRWPYSSSWHIPSDYCTRNATGKCVTCGWFSTRCFWTWLPLTLVLESHGPHGKHILLWCTCTLRMFLVYTLVCSSRAIEFRIGG